MDGTESRRCRTRHRNGNLSGHNPVYGRGGIRNTVLVSYIVGVVK